MPVTVGSQLGQDNKTVEESESGVAIISLSKMF